MDKFDDLVIFELTKEYVFKNFDFKSKSPEDLAKLYKETYSKIKNVFEKLDKFNEVDIFYSSEN